MIIKTSKKERKEANEHLEKGGEIELQGIVRFKRRLLKTKLIAGKFYRFQARKVR